MQQLPRASLWAMPAEADAPLFADRIARLAQAAGSAPFPPHITLLGSVPPDAELDAVATVEPFTVSLTAVEHSDERFRAVTLRAESAELVAAHQMLAAVARTPPREYSPHLSLLYGEFDAARRAELVTQVNLTLPMRIVVDAVELVDTSDADFTRWSVVERWELR